MRIERLPLAYTSSLPKICSSRGCSRSPAPKRSRCQKCMAKERDRLFYEQKKAIYDEMFALDQGRVSPRGYMWIYFIGTGDLEVVKIGRTLNLESRLSSLQVGCPTKLEVVIAFSAHKKVEDQLHKRFKAQNIHGEWFRNEEGVKEAIETLKAGEVPDYISDAYLDDNKNLIYYGANYGIYRSEE